VTDKGYDSQANRRRGASTGHHASHPPAREPKQTGTLLSEASLQTSGTYRTTIGKLKRFKRVAMARQTTSATSLISFACGLMLAKTVTPA